MTENYQQQELEESNVDWEHSSDANMEEIKLMDIAESNFRRTGAENWTLLRNVFRAALLFQTTNINTRKMSSILEDVRRIPTDKEYKKLRLSKKRGDPLGVALDDHRRELRIYELFERGSPDDILEIDEMLINDPYRHIRSLDNPMSLVNKRDSRGYTPLYMAAMNGNLELLKYLLNHSADPYIHSTIENHDSENILTVASRWGYLAIVEYLLKNVKWKNLDIKKARGEVSHQTVKAVFDKNTKKSSKCGCFGK